MNSLRRELFTALFVSISAGVAASIPLRNPFTNTRLSLSHIDGKKARIRIESDVGEWAVVTQSDGCQVGNGTRRER
jgi:hypothetical protein